ncbi:hypothetical protein QTP70_014016 [Hemibagrus guttatus]|uniref:ubiquitinyl hydrolase 1 n=1 Tax=Hemibagrus guttatus TaxID=175788 RepID=A0AAE0VBM0_9TELE|nr:hypothetical protein QTP70_014016 [Hemibagrus guttatus]
MAESSEVLMSVLSTIRVPRPGDRVHKDECALSFASPESEGGLYVCMNSFLGFGSCFVERHHARTGQRAYLHIKRTRKPHTPKEDDGSTGSGDPPKKKPTRLAIGIEGGFDVEQEQYEEEVKVVLFPDRQEVTSDDLATMPDVVRERVSLSMAGLLAADSVSQALQVQQWDGEVRQESKHAAELKQLDNGVKIPPSGWKCEVCDLQENLWMNLTDGKILCGRRYFDGSGGNNHALQYFQESGYPLAVKLGTITPDGADVYSYDEDDMVLDSKLAEHLTHFGIDMMTMEKTERTMTELEIAVNQRVGEWEVIQESGTTLRPLWGPGLTGMKNLGNSCYLNSVMQVLFTIPDFQEKYVSSIDKILDEAPSDPSQDFKTQVAKLGYGLLSGEYSKPAPDPGDDPSASSEPRGDQVGIAPRMFKALVGRGHPEFSTNRQQDAQEFFLHFINMVERNCRSGPNPSEAFRFLVEERIVCQQSQKAKYTQRVDYIVQLPVPMDQATNTEELQEAERLRDEAESSGNPPPVAPRAQIPFSACMNALSEPETLTDFWSSAVQGKTTATKTTRFASFPDYLVIQIKKFTFGLDWVPKKLDVSIDVPDTLDLSDLRGTGPQPEEELLPEVAPPPLMTPDVEVKAPVLDESTVSQLCEMGFPLEACRKAVYYTGNTGIDAAMNWVMGHMDDADFAAPLVLPGSSSAPGSTPTESLSEEHLATIVSMGFSRDQASRALKATSNILERAVDWIFSHLDDLESMEVSEGGRSEGVSEASRDVPPGPRVRDGPGKYELFAFISHMGTSTMCGHYVCHIKKDQHGDNIILDCGKSPLREVEWKLNNNLVLHKDKSGRQRKANLDISTRARIDGNLLKISNLKSNDSGTYTCNKFSHTLYVASAHANPSTVLHNSDTKLSCDITGNFKKVFHWISPKSEKYDGNEVTLKNVTSDFEGVWSCHIKNEKQEDLIKLSVTISVVGPLITKQEVFITEGGTAVLPCVLLNFKGLSLTGGSWTHSNSGVQLVTLMRKEGILQWNKTNVSTGKVAFSDKELSTVFNVTLKKVKLADAGVYVCSLLFENGKSLNAELTLRVSKRDGSAPGIDSDGSTVQTNMQTPILGLPKWIWIAGGVGAFCLIVLVVVIVWVCRRNKRMKREIKKSMRQPRNYCTCNRTRRQPGKSPGKRERPPPLPRHQYNSLNE